MIANNIRKMNAASVVPVTNLLLLDADCLSEIMSWLTLSDLLNVSRTCKRLNRIAGDVFQTNYTGIIARAIPNGIIAKTYLHSPRMDELMNFIENILFRVGYTDDMDLVATEKNIVSNCNKFVKQIQLFYCNLNRRWTECIEELFANVEHLVIHGCRVHPYAYKTIPRVCANMKRLSVSEVEFEGVNLGENQWLLQYYPQLEHLE